MAIFILGIFLRLALGVFGRFKGIAVWLHFERLINRMRNIFFEIVYGRWNDG
jgi:hypothetical protein